MRDVIRPGQTWEALVTIPGLWAAGERIRVKEISPEGLAFFRFVRAVVPREPRLFYTGPQAFLTPGELRLLYE